MIPEAAGETWDEELGRSAGLDTLKLLEELTLGVAGREGLGVLTADGEYHESIGFSWGRAWACSSREPLRQIYLVSAGQS